MRFSTSKQRKGRGKGRQDAQASRWCKAHGFTLEPANCFADLGVSAFKGRHIEHGDLRRFLRLIDDGRIEKGSTLLVESLDRLSRDNVNIAQEIFLLIINRGVIVVTLVDNCVYRADADPHTLMAQMMISLAIFSPSERREPNEKRAEEGQLEGQA